MKEVSLEFEIKNIEDIKPFLDELSRLYLEAYKGLEKYSYTRPRDVKDYLRWLFKRDKEGFFVVFDETGKIVGFVATDANWFKNGSFIGEIHELVVSPEVRGRGLGKELVLKALDYFRKKGLKRSGLWVGEHNERARKLYQDLGYLEVGRKGKWIRMERDLS